MPADKIQLVTRSGKGAALTHAEMDANINQISAVIDDATLLKSSVSNVNNTSDSNKPVGIAQQTALDAKLDATATATAANKLATARLIAGVSFDGTANITLSKSNVGLGNIDNTSDANKPVSIAQAAAITAVGQAIGDTLITSKTPDTNYLPADNSVYLKSAYPSLAALVGNVSMDSTIPKLRSLPVVANWVSATYGNGVFVAISGNGSISSVAATSPDGITWTQRALPTANYWTSVTYGNGVFVALTTGSTIAATSPDGITWTQRTLPVSASWQSVTYGNGLFVAVAMGSTIAATSPDGITWTQRVLPTSVNWSAVAYGNGVFVSLATNTTVAATSPDGITWTQRTLPVLASWYSIAYGNGLFVATGGSTIAVTSPDGIIWTQRSLPVGSNLGAVTYGNGVFMACAGNATSNICATSTDGITWTSRSLLSLNNWWALAYGNGVFVSLVYNSSVAMSYPMYWYDPTTQFATPLIQTGSGLKTYIKAT